MGWQAGSPTAKGESHRHAVHSKPVEDLEYGGLLSAGPGGSPANSSGWLSGEHSYEGRWDVLLCTRECHPHGELEAPEPRLSRGLGNPTAKGLRNNPGLDAPEEHDRRRVVVRLCSKRPPPPSGLLDIPSPWLGSLGRVDTTTTTPRPMAD